VNDDLMRELHFGGGLNSKDETNAGAEGQGKQRTKKEIMEEVISKSKFYKASALSQEGIMACCCLMFVSVVKHLM
jgi:hypothetical protein